MDNLYDQLVRADILTPIKHLIDGGFVPPMTPDGKIHVRYVLDFNEMWIHAKHDTARRCGVWHKIWFNCYKFIPKGCRNCWKVTFKPGSLKDAFATMRLQEQMGLPAKVGMERRPFTGSEGGFSAFWYAPLEEGLEGGRALWKKVRSALDQSFGVGSYKPILKRGCTEMEGHFPPSSDWDKVALERGWDQQEALVGSVFVLPVPPAEQPMAMKVRNMKAWIEWCFEHSGVTGDESYQEYIGSDPVPPIEKYQESIHSNKDFKSTWEGKDGTNNNGSEDTSESTSEERIESWLGATPESPTSVCGGEREDSGECGITTVEGLASA